MKKTSMIIFPINDIGKDILIMEVDKLSKEKLEQNQQEEPMSLLAMSLTTGFVGGILWSFIGLISYVFHFTEIKPNVVLEPWALGDWKNDWIGTVISIGVIGLFGMGAAFIYYAFLRKFKTIWIGIAYGVLLFAIVFFILNPLFPSLKSIFELKRTTIITTICLYVLFGVFVGYSISYEANEREIRKEKQEKEEKSFS